MNPLALIVLLLVIATPIAWFASEFQDRRWVRLTLGTAAILVWFGVTYLVGLLDRFNFNAWFGGATKNLIDATIEELESGNQSQVLLALKRLQSRYQPSYENRAQYDALAAQAVADMRNRAAGP